MISMEYSSLLSALEFFPLCAYIPRNVVVGSYGRSFCFVVYVWVMAILIYISPTMP